MESTEDGLTRSGRFNKGGLCRGKTAKKGQMLTWKGEMVLKGKKGS